MPDPNRSLNDAWRDAARDLDDVAVDAALEARVIAAATRPPSRAPAFAGVAAIVVVAFVAFRAASGDALVVDKSPGAIVAVDGTHATLREGRARFTVDADDTPIVIDAGERRLTATKATVDIELDAQDRGGGRAVVASGNARLAVVDDGSFEELHAGDSRSWRNRALTAKPATTPTPTLVPTTATPTTNATTLAAKTTAVATTAPKTTTTPTTETPTLPTTNPTTDDGDALRVKAVLARVQVLRKAGRNDDALHAIDAADIHDARAQESLSVERGLLLEKVGREQEACAWWRQHLTRFPSGRSHVEVAAAVAQCDEVP